MVSLLRTRPVVVLGSSLRDPSLVRMCLEAGDVFHAQAGTEHRAEPLGVARILVIEREGSV